MVLTVLADRSRCKVQRKVWKTSQTSILVPGVLLTGPAGWGSELLPSPARLCSSRCAPWGYGETGPKYHPCLLGAAGLAGVDEPLITAVYVPSALSDSVGTGVEPVPASLQGLSRAHASLRPPQCPTHGLPLPSLGAPAVTRILIWVLLSIFCQVFSSVSWLPCWICSKLRPGITDE